MSRSTLLIPLLAGALFVVCPVAVAQTDPQTLPSTPQTPPSLPPQETPEPAARPAEIDQTLVNTWTTLPLKRGHGYFRLTHRFARDLGRGSFGDLADDFFSLDNGAVVGLDEQDSDDESDAIDTFFVGLGARARVLDTVTLVFEVAPRLAGYTPDSAVWGAAIEKVTRGHVLQLNFGNSFGTTPGMLARGGASDEVYLGFNLSRKF